MKVASNSDLTLFREGPIVQKNALPWATLTLRPASDNASYVARFKTACMEQ